MSKDTILMILSFIPLAITVGVLIKHWVKRKQLNAVLDVLETYADPLSGPEIQKECHWRISDDRLIDILWELNRRGLTITIAEQDQPIKWVLEKHMDYGLNRNL